MRVRALTLWRPWPALILHAGKNIENRPWATSYRGRLYLHAGQRWDSAVLGSLWSSSVPVPIPNAVPRDADGHPTGIVGVATLEWVSSGPGGPPRCKCGPWAIPGEFHWRLADPVALPEPVPCRGFQGLWIPTGDVIAAVEAQLGGGS